MTEPFDRLSHFGDVESLHALLESTPYTRMLGIGVAEEPAAPAIAGDGTPTPVLVLRFSDDIIGNIRLPAIHGGVIGALLETTALATLIWASSSEFSAEPPLDGSARHRSLASTPPAYSPESLPKTIDISFEYLRSGRARDTFAQATITKHGRRVANVRVVAWQEDPARPIAAAHGHFLIKPKDERPPAPPPRTPMGQPDAGSGA